MIPNLSPLFNSVQSLFYPRYSTLTVIFSVTNDLEIAKTNGKFLILFLIYQT